MSKPVAQRSTAIANAGASIIASNDSKGPPKRERLVWKDKNDQDIVTVEHKLQDLKLPTDTQYEYFMMQSSQNKKPNDQEIEDFQK